MFFCWWVQRLIRLILAFFWHETWDGPKKLFLALTQCLPIDGKTRILFYFTWICQMMQCFMAGSICFLLPYSEKGKTPCFCRDQVHYPLLNCLSAKPHWIKWEALMHFTQHSKKCFLFPETRWPRTRSCWRRRWMRTTTTAGRRSRPWRPTSRRRGRSWGDRSVIVVFKIRQD